MPKICQQCNQTINLDALFDEYSALMTDLESEVIDNPTDLQLAIAMGAYCAPCAQYFCAEA